MIFNKKDLNRYLDSDSLHYEILYKSSFLSKLKYKIGFNPISDQNEIWNYIYYLRHLEYNTNYKALNKRLMKLHKGRFCKLKIFLATCMNVYYRHKLKRVSYKTGFQIPPNTVSKGLTIWHWGTIIINPTTTIGQNCVLYPGVLIGHKIPGQGAAHIGNNCFIGSGAKIIGNVIIGDNVTIAPNSVVTKNVPSNVVYGGIPGKIIHKIIEYESSTYKFR